MAKFLITKSETSVILTVFIQDSSSTTGAGLGSLDQTSSIVGGYVKRNDTGVALAVDENVTTEGTYEAPSTAAQVRIGTPANMRTGVYELHFHNDLFTTEDWVLISLGGASNMADLLMEVQLSSTDVNDAVTGGMTALPNAAADAAGGLPISDAGGLDLDTILDVAVSTRSDFDETTDPVELIDSGGAAGTSADELVDDVWDEILTGATHNVSTSSGRRLRELQESGAVYGGFIWIDTVNGTAGTEDYINGTSDNPVDSIADANTLAASVGIDRFQVAPGSTITFAATQSNEMFIGREWTLALGAQAITGTYIEGATVSGTGTGAAAHFASCEIGTTTLANCRMGFCRFTDTITMSAASDYYFHDCYSGVAGSGTPVIDFGAGVANTNLSMRRYSGGIQIDNKDGTGTDLMSLEGNGQLVVDATSGGAISIRGNFRVTNTGGATITYDDNTQGLVDVETDTADIQSRIPAALVGGRIDANVGAISADSTAADNLELACDNYSATRGLTGTAVPAVAADGAGGLTISDAGGLDLDAQDTNINDIETAVDAILVDTGTTIPALLPAALVSGRMSSDVRLHRRCYGLRREPRRVRRSARPGHRGHGDEHPHSDDDRVPVRHDHGSYGRSLQRAHRDLPHRRAYQTGN